MHFNLYYYFCRLFADILNDIAMFVEILAPYFPAFFTLIMCVSGTFKVRQTSDGVIDYLCFFFDKFTIICTKKTLNVLSLYSDWIAKIKKIT